MQNTHKWLSRFRLKSDVWVYVPTLETIAKGKELKKQIQLKWRPPLNYYHLRGGGHVESIRSHVVGKYFIHADLKKFFNNINRSRITRELKPYFGYKMARAIAMESTVSIPAEFGQTFALPFGFVQSTIVASLCLHKSTLGKMMDKLHRSPGTRVSVYVDDIIISTQTLQAAEQALHQITESCKKSGLTLNEQKLEGPSQNITAFNINLDEFSTSIDVARFQILRATYKKPKNGKQKEGIRSYVYSVNPAQVLALDI
ncbi:reverse transcriptase domain-containing protein [Pseudomonas putida]|uniref:reverse transcriptase domain-containing protein n=1 Tax=Pseudomonas TaxID=286 RepID=UPI000629DDE9|nr:reverse transcriptase domain-containing protein [Pseudomonas putida]